jgi:hypothetical protein
MRASITVLLFTTLAFAFTATARAQESTSLTDAISAGKLTLNLRPRYENVDQANFSENAEALTMRTLLGWNTGSWYGLSANAELINVSRAISDYNDTLNGKTQYPVIADPDDNDINQLYLDYRGIQKTLIRGGRQSIKLDKVRFIGNVEFRQVMQVFNGVTAENTSLPNTRLYAGYLGRVKTITTRQYQTDTILLNAHYSLTPEEALVAYGYLQDQANAIAATAFQGPAPSDTSNQIFGIRGDGAHPINDAWKLLYTAEFARQTDYASGDSRIDADYLRLGAGAQWGGYQLRVDYEQLGSNDGQYAFQTPLGTNHLYQGWADQFLTTPRQGIQDTYITGSAKIEKATLQAEYHMFDADYGGLDFGDELDLGVSYPLMKKLVGKIEYADYQAGDPGSNKVDVTKFWLTLIFNY